MSAFRLQRVLEQRRRREDEMKQRLAAARAAQAAAEAQLAALIAAEARRRAEMSALLAGGRVDAGRVQELGRVIEACGRQIVDQRHEVARRAAFTTQEHGRLLAASVERKALEVLGERHAERRRDADKRREQASQEEIGAFGAAISRSLSRA